MVSFEKSGMLTSGCQRPNLDSFTIHNLVIKCYGDILRGVWDSSCSLTLTFIDNIKSKPGYAQETIPIIGMFTLNRAKCVENEAESS